MVELRGLLGLPAIRLSGAPSKIASPAKPVAPAPPVAVPSGRKSLRAVLAALVAAVALAGGWWLMRERAAEEGRPAAPAQTAPAPAGTK
jgi:hypothetical protein